MNEVDFFAYLIKTAIVFTCIELLVSAHIEKDLSAKGSIQVWPIVLQSVEEWKSPEWKAWIKSPESVKIDHMNSTLVFTLC